MEPTAARVLRPYGTAPAVEIPLPPRRPWWKASKRDLLVVMALVPAGLAVLVRSAGGPGRAVVVGSWHDSQVWLPLGMVAVHGLRLVPASPRPPGGRWPGSYDGPRRLAPARSLATGHRRVAVSRRYDKCPPVGGHLHLWAILGSNLNPPHWEHSETIDIFPLIGVRSYS